MLILINPFQILVSIIFILYTICLPITSNFYSSYLPSLSLNHYPSLPVHKTTAYAHHPYVAHPFLFYRNFPLYPLNVHRSPQTPPQPPNTITQTCFLPYLGDNFTRFV